MVILVPQYFPDYGANPVISLQDVIDLPMIIRMFIGVKGTCAFSSLLPSFSASLFQADNTPMQPNLAQDTKERSAILSRKMCDLLVRPLSPALSFSPSPPRLTYLLTYLLPL